MAQACPGVRTPALVLADEGVALTRREREVALLAAQGLPSKTIAERLYVSVRTVDNHLQRVYDKLGARGRDELAALLGSD
jgi:DNA-binding CsgD family transcriptional regulator